jgi:hypothetical protein
MTKTSFTADAAGSNEQVHIKGTNGCQNGYGSTDNTSINGLHAGIIGDEASVNRIHGPKAAPPEPVAICGMSVRLPGGLHTPQELWEFLISKGDARAPVPKSRYNVSAHYSERQKPGTVKTEYGYFLDESIDISAIDTSFFNMGKAEVERTDPQQRQMLEVARECMEDAGERNWKGRPIGCYMGSFGEDWAELFAKDNQQHGLYRVTGYGDFMLPNRVSYEMDLMGPRSVHRRVILYKSANKELIAWQSGPVALQLLSHYTKHVWRSPVGIARELLLAEPT